VSARDELAALIGSKLDRLFGSREFGPAKQDFDLADELIAAGYSKPRTITTAEEVEALLQGTKLFSTRTTHSWHLNDLSHPHGGTRVQGTGGGYTHLEDFIKHEAPMVVLYTPEATK